MAFQVRRVITGHDDNGRAVVKIDEVCTHAFTGRPGATGINVWTTEGFPANNDGAEDAGLRKVGTTLPDGTIFRMLEFAPGLAARNHRTDSIDYIVVLSGEIEMELDDTVVQLRAGDVMVNRSTNHNWSQSGPSRCDIRESSSSCFKPVGGRPAGADRRSADAPRGSSGGRPAHRDAPLGRVFSPSPTVAFVLAGGYVASPSGRGGADRGFIG
jgi:mannose-6-phosphate isomerase-like protein (cupin superfamily)